MAARRSEKLRKVVTLHSLRNKLKRDPEGYRDEFLQQLAQFQSTFNVLKIRASGGASSTSRQTKDVSELIDFLSHVAPYFPTECREFPDKLLDLLENHLEGLQPTLRKNIVKALILLRNRHFVSPLVLLPVFFRLFRISDKALRKLVFSHIVQVITRVNKKHKDLKLNGALQNFMYKMLQDENPIAVRKSLGVMMELYRKRVWQDAKTVNVLSRACFSKHSCVLRTALRFFLGEVVVADDDEEDEEKKLQQQVVKAQVGMKGTKRKSKRKRVIDRAQEKLKKNSSKQANQLGGRDFSLIRSVYDPQTFTERLFSALKRSNEAFDIRVLYMNVISRFIGCHELELFDFYPFLQKYMQPHQEYVTRILVYLAQSCHAKIPPEALQSCVQTLANHFITDRSSPEVIAVGLNSIREICARQPLVMDKTLLQDLTQYKNYKNKSVAIASRSIIHLYRSKNPELLMKKDRGGSKSKISEFGEVEVPTDLPGADLLVQEIQAREESGEILDDDWQSREDSDGDDDEDHDITVIDLEEFDDEKQAVDEFERSGGIRFESSDSEKEEISKKDERTPSEVVGDGEPDDAGDDSELKPDDSTPVPDDIRPVSDDIHTSTDETSSSSSSSQTTPPEVTGESISDEKKPLMRKKPLPATALKIFTPRELDRLKEIQIQKVVKEAKSFGRKEVVLVKASAQETSEFAIDEDDISSFGIKRKREDDDEEDKGKKKKHKFPGQKVAGATNVDKLRNKPLKMTLYSRKSKRKRSRSFSQKEAVLKRHITRTKVNQHKRKRKKKIRN